MIEGMETELQNVIYT